MKNILYIVLCVFQLFILKTSFANEFDKGLSLANKKEYAKAINHFKQVLKKDSLNASAYYNIGYCQFQLNQLGESIWSFEKAIQYDPKNSNALKNIEIAHSKLNLAEYEPIYSGTIRSLFAFGTSNWSILAIVNSVIIATLLILFKLKRGISSKRILFVFIFIALLFELTSIWLAYESHQAFHYQTGAIITHPSIPTYLNVDGEKSVVALPEGTRIESFEALSNDKFNALLVNGQEVIIDGSGWKKL